MGWSIWSASALAHVVLLVLAVAVLLSGRTSAGDSGGPTAGNRFLALLFLLLPVALAAWVAGLLVFGQRTSGGVSVAAFARSDMFLAALGLALVPQILFHGVTTWLAFRSGNVLAYLVPVSSRQLRRRKQRLLAGTRAGLIVFIVSGLIVVLLGLMILPSLELFAGVMAGVVAIGVALWTGHRNADKVDESLAYTASSNLELYKEQLIAVAAQFGWTVRNVSFYRVINRSANSPGREGDDIQLAAGLDRWRNTFDPRNPTLPEELTHKISSHVLSAGLAMRYANASLINPFRIKALGGLPPWGLGLVLAGALLFLAGELVLLFRALGMELGEAMAFGLMISAFVTVGFALFAVGRRSRSFHHLAYAAWRQVAEGNPASPEDFATSLVAYDQAMKPLLPAEEIEKRTRGDRRLQAFLQSAKPDLSETSLAGSQ